MPTQPETHGAVKAVEDSLECSPSATSPGSSLYNAGNQPQAAKHSPKHRSGAGGTMTNAESGFGEKGKAKRRNMAVKP